MELDPPEHYQRQAKRLRRRAAYAASDTIRDQMLRIATDLDQLADSIEAVRKDAAKERSA
jgi:hypothetical protein